MIGKELSRPVILDSRLSAVLGVALFTALTALGAFVRIPLPGTPVPVTLQVFFVLLSAVVLGRKAAISQALYVALGAAGLPVFTGAGAGFDCLLGPTGGYLLGFVAAAFIVGTIARENSSTLSMTMSLLLGVAIIYMAGAIQLGLLLHLGLVKTLQLGILPFIVGDLLKTAAVIAAARAMRR